jgi:hypothetical protein
MVENCCEDLFSDIIKFGILKKVLSSNPSQPFLSSSTVEAVKMVTSEILHHG